MQLLLLFMQLLLLLLQLLLLLLLMWLWQQVSTVSGWSCKTTGADVAVAVRLFILVQFASISEAISSPRFLAPSPKVCATQQLPDPDSVLWLFVSGLWLCLLLAGGALLLSLFIQRSWESENVRPMIKSSYLCVLHCLGRVQCLTQIDFYFAIWFTWIINQPTVHCRKFSFLPCNLVYMND